eukprot:907934-Amphidinium_carterae.4
MRLLLKKGLHYLTETQFALIRRALRDFSEVIQSLLQPPSWHCIYPVKKGVRYSAVYYALNHLERLSGDDWNTLVECGFNPKLSPTQVVAQVKAAYGELTEHDAHMEVLREMDDALHEMTEHQDLEKNKPKDDGKARELHEREGHLPKDPACPACIRESGSRVVHYKGHEPHYGTLYMDMGKMNKPDYFGREYYLVAGLRVRLENDTGVLLSCFVPIESTARTSSRRRLSNGEHVFDNPVFRKHALDLGIGVYNSPPYQPQSNGIAERLVGMSKMLVKRLLESNGLETFYWNYAVTHATDLFRHRALKLTYPNPALGENVGIYTSQDEGKVKALSTLSFNTEELKELSARQGFSTSKAFSFKAFSVCGACVCVAPGVAK